MYVETEFMSLELYAAILTPILTLFIGAWLNKRLEDHPKLVSYISHATATRLDPPAQGAQPITVHTHSLVIRNNGRKPATNVRIGHNVLPNFQVFPQIQYEVVTVPNGGKEILFPRLVPREQVTINYVYFPPLLWSGINTMEKSDEGLANRVSVLLTRRYPMWFQLLSAALALLGVATLVYWIIRLIVLIVT
jgi:hypothetical protein